jgi:mono/diheme cytochrome c family protein
VFLQSGPSREIDPAMHNPSLLSEGPPVNRGVGRRHAGWPLLRWLLLVAAFCSLGQAARGQTPSSILRGQQIAERLCVGCHAIHGAGIIVEGTRVPTFSAIAGRPNQTREGLGAFIMTPHRPMPGSALDTSEVRDVVEYVLSLK